MNKVFDLHQLPIAYFSDNKESRKLNQYIARQQVGTSECSEGELEKIFFSEENMDLLNKQLIISVYKNTNGDIKIPFQSYNSLLIVMRYVYIEYAKNLPYNIYSQIQELNCRVINEILPDVITNATQQIEYLRVISSHKELLPLPKNVSNTKILKGTASFIIER